MFVRLKKNKSGSTSVQIIDKERNYKVIKTLGCSTDLEIIEKLRLEAQELIYSSFNKQIDLFSANNVDYIAVTSIANSDIITIGPELIFGKLFDEIGFSAIPEELFRHLTICRLVYPVSKLKTIDYLRNYKGIDMSVQRIYRFLDRFNQDYKTQVEQISFEYTKSILKEISVVFYDVTTLYFEAEDEDDLRKIGFSKDGKFQCPQILIGLLVGVDGYPIGYEIFEGNKFEGKTLIPVLEGFQAKYNLGKPIIIADAGLLSNKNLETLEDNKYQYIIGARIKNESQEIKKQILDKTTVLADGASFVIPKNENLKLIIGYSEKRAKKDAHNRKRGISKLEKRIKTGKLTKESINNRGYNKFLKLETEVKVSLDQFKVNEDTKWDGLKGYITNTDLPSSDVIENYKHLWKIEKAFRISKTDLRIRPVYHYRKRRIEAHICISFVAYTIYKELERILKQNKCQYSPKKVAELSQTMYQLVYRTPGTIKEKTQLLKMNKEQKEIFNILC